MCPMALAKTSWAYPNKTRGQRVFSSLDIKKAFDRFWWTAVRGMAVYLEINDKLVMNPVIE